MEQGNVIDDETIKIILFLIHHLLSIPSNNRWDYIRSQHTCNKVFLH